MVCKESFMSAQEIHPPTTPPEPEKDSTSEVDLDALVNDILEDDPHGEPEAQPETEHDKTRKVVQLLPVHAAPNVGGKSRGSPLVVDRQRGRPRKVERMPTTSDLEYHAAITEEKAKYVDADDLLKAGRAGADHLRVLALVKIEIMKEAAALAFQRIENEKYGRDTQQTSSRRVDALTKIANIELELKKLGGDDINVNSEKMQRIFKFFIDTVRAILEENLAPEQIDLVFNRLSTEFEGWQEKLADVLR